MSADATRHLIERMSNPDEWDDILRNVPIFREHDLYEVESGGKRYRVPVLPGEKAPTGAKFLYRVDRRRLEKIARAINKNLDDHWKPIKLFDGHTENPSKVPQTRQPEILGWGGRARVMAWGPKNATVLAVPCFVEKGKGAAVKGLPERSPEFYPDSDEITGVALLKTDPKLPMGMLTYGQHRLTRAFRYSAAFASDGAVLYGRDAMATNPKPTEERTRKPVAYEEEHGSEGEHEKKEGEDHGRELEPLSEEEAHQAARYMAHYEKYHAPTKYMCSKYAESMAAAGPENAQLPGEAPPENEDEKEHEPPAHEDDDGEEEAEQHARAQRDEKYAKMAQRIAMLEQDKARSEVEAILGKLEKEVVITAKGRTRLLDRYMRAEPKTWTAITEEVRESYQRREEDPTTEREFPDHENYVAEVGADQFNVEKDMKAAQRYMREKGYDPRNDEEWDEACKHAVAVRLKGGK